MQDIFFKKYPGFKKRQQNAQQHILLCMAQQHIGQLQDSGGM
jgi:hypothetical protein